MHHSPWQLSVDPVLTEPSAMVNVASPHLPPARSLAGSAFSVQEMHCKRPRTCPGGPAIQFLLYSPTPGRATRTLLPPPALTHNDESYCAG